MKFKEYIYKYIYNIYSIAIVVLANPWRVRGGSWGIRGGFVGDPWRVRGGSVADLWRIRGGSVADPWRICGESVAGSWGICGGSVAGSWGIRGGFGRFLKIPLFYGTFWPLGEYFGPLWGGLLH